jgi:hypothetical protein
MKKERRGKWRQCEQTYELKGIGKECPPQLLIPYCERKFWQIPRRKRKRWGKKDNIGRSEFYGKIKRKGMKCAKE